MSGLEKWLERDFEALVDAASDALSSTPEARVSVRPAIESFYSGLIESAQQAESAPLNRVLGSWVEARTVPSAGETTRFVPEILALKNLTLDFAVERNEPEVAVSLLRELNHLMDAAVAFLGELELSAALKDVWRELEHAQVDLKRLEQSKSDFISVAAHELRTPLTLLEGYANMLREEFPPDEFPRVAVMLGGISNGTMRLRDIINDMIDVSLIDMDILELHIQPVWPGRLVAIVVAELGPTATARGQKIVVELPEGKDKPVLGDAERLHQVLRNVISNAIKFTPDGGAITIRTRSLPQFLDVQVSDTGIGIDPDDLERIFDRFAPIADVALHSSSKTNFKGGGPGLGLAIAKGIVEAHGGNIWAESLGYDEERCPGSTFHIMLPERPVNMQQGESEGELSMSELYDATQEHEQAD